MRMNMENFISFLGVLPLLARCDFHALAYSVRFTILRLRKIRDFMYFSSFSPQSSPKGNSYIFCFPRIPMAPSKKKGVCCPVAQCLLQLLTSHLCSHVRTRNIIQYSMNTYPICDSPLYRDRRGAQSRPRALAPSRSHALAPSRLFAEITVLTCMCEQKPYLVWFSFQRRSCPVQCEHNLSLVECEFSISLSTNLCSARMDRR